MEFDLRYRFKTLKQLNTVKGGDNGALNEGIFLVQSRRSGQLYIEKRIKERDIRDGHGDRERRALKQCDHPNIVAFIGSNFDTHYGYGSIYMQHCDLGALDTLIKRLKRHGRYVPEGFVWRVFFQLSLALCYLMHGVDAKAAIINRCNIEPVYGWNHICHRDIKPGNVFLASESDPRQKYPRVMLGDFGCSVLIDDIDARVACELTSRQARSFSPPESPEYSRRGDVYMVGLVIHCLCRLLEVPERDKWHLREKPVGSYYSNHLTKVVKTCVRKHPNDRPSTAELPEMVYSPTYFRKSCTAKSGSIPKSRSPIP
ncbi:kinase-like protein [Zopfia rhizophila CBS 207.26]|uniref:non-specific serine/threonine protein kinase n=1 Tax=Zopfia rhizophila CBS 207.26 TaxID=1314779 RepID=A0A6A6DN11_9PEZI|nr:kinase-like protein [Zopfia rhizophila CBS 207.26]